MDIWYILTFFFLLGKVNFLDIGYIFINFLTLFPLVHHGLLFVPIGYTFGDDMSKIDFIHGGSPYGAGVYAGDGTREPIEIELALAEHQGKYVAGVAKRLSQG
ncbi:hypothetical protein J1N35_025167 [Gossypium stocksii]|uniref:Flavodoxin-like domain-containing protein n=1 Tax=Gossypium stocksii TaxID=47602 RepID=A0A9D3V614_9ROSI|nr:hypothetical protein J1N35_025167 [Gossypium stocksii]